MEGKDKKKESIDEILSDLNGLLNKMPSILDGIKMPELQPLEQPGPRQAQPPAEAPAQPPAEAPAEPPAPQAEPQFHASDADKTVVLQPFSGLQEGAPEPVQEQAPAQPEAEQLAPQSLGDFMFGQDAAPQPAAEPPAARPARLSGSTLQPPDERERPAAAQNGASLSVSEFSAPEERPAAALPAYEATKDFGIPDIDALIQLSEGAAPQPAGKPQVQEAGVIPAGVREIEAQDGGLADAGRPAEVNAVENNELPKEEAASPEPEQPVERQPDATFDSFAIDSTPQEAAQPAADAGGETLRLDTPQDMPAADAGGETLRLDTPQDMPAADAGGETLRLDTPQDMPAADAGVETLRLDTPQDMPAADAGGETLRLDTPQDMPAADAGGETLRLDTPQDMPAADAGVETLRLDTPQDMPAADAGGPGLQLETPQDLVSAAAGQEPRFGVFPGVEEAAPAAAPAPESQPAPSSGGIELSPAIDLGAAPAPAAAAPAGPAGSAGADETLPGGGGLELSVGNQSAGDATLVVQPPASSGQSGDEEKTVIFQASPATTTRAQAGDLASLAAKQPPEGVPAERQRPLMFVYSMEDKSLCATVLAELDAICLKSASKPMFIKRAAVKECDPDVNPNFLQQSVAECGALGLICLGNVPGDKVSEIEGVFSAANGFFRYYDSNTFNHSAALDLVADLIVR